MARPLRIGFPGAIYHVIAGGNARQALFHGEDATMITNVCSLARTYLGQPQQIV